MPDAGSWPDYLAGIGAIVALIWARRAARAAKQSSDIQQNELSRMTDEAQKRVANNFAVWLEAAPNQKARYRVSNASGQPVFNLVCWWTEDPKRCRPIGSAVVPPGEWWIPEHMPLVPPSLPLGPTEYRQMWISYSFTDHGQRKWIRGLSGELKEGVRAPSTNDIVGPLYPATDGAWWNTYDQIR